MTKNSLLNIGIGICKFFRIFSIIAFVILAILLVHYQINPSSYENVEINSKMNNSVLYIKWSTSTVIKVNDEVSDNSNPFVLSKLKSSSLYFNLLKVFLIMLFFFLNLKEFQKIIESVKEIKTFQERNVLSFRRIGKYMLIIFVLMSYSSFNFQQGHFSSFQISFGLLILSLLSYIMAEVFKEGNNLYEENKLTV